MRRRYKANAAAAAPAAADLASDGYPSEGDANAGTPATIPGPYWFHLVTEAIVTVIEEAGLALTDDAGQFLEALKMVAAAQSPYATDDEAIAGALRTKVMNPANTKAVIDQLLDGAPAALDTLNELAAALADDADYAATVTAALALKAPLASPALSGNPTAPTQPEGDNSTRIATTAFAKRVAEASRPVVLASDIDLAADARVTKNLARPLNEFRWVEILTGSTSVDHGDVAKVQRSAIAALNVAASEVLGWAAGRQLYVVNTASGALTPRGERQPALALVSASLVSTGERLLAWVSDQVSSSTDHHVLYEINPDTGARTPLGSVDAPWANSGTTLPSAAVWTGSELLGLVSRASSNRAQLYQIDLSDGTLTPRGSEQSNFDTSSKSDLGAAWTGTEMLVAIFDDGQDRFRLYSVDTSDGTLAPRGSARSLGTGSWTSGALVWTGTELLAWVGDQNSDDAQLYGVNTADGTLTPRGSEQSVSDQSFIAFGMTSHAAVSGGLDVGGVRLDRDGANSLGLTSGKALHVHQIVGIA